MPIYFFTLTIVHRSGDYPGSRSTITGTVSADTDTEAHLKVELNYQNDYPSTHFRRDIEIHPYIS